MQMFICVKKHFIGFMHILFNKCINETVLFLISVMHNLMVYVGADISQKAFVCSK